MPEFLNSAWRCHCGEQQRGPRTTYKDALSALRAHQAEAQCAARTRGPGDRIHSERMEAESEIYREIDREPMMELVGPPKPPTPRDRSGREGLAWLPGNELHARGKLRAQP